MSGTDHNETMLSSLLDYLSSSKMAGRPVDPDEELLISGTLDSMKVMNLVNFVEEYSNFSVEVEEVLPENFGTPSSIVAFMAVKSGN